jgi:hypothetical protein
MGKDFGSAITSCPKRPLNENNNRKKPVTIRVSVFFDGTGNNKFNTQERLNNSFIYNIIPKTIGGSYENDFSNVAKLYECLSENNSSYDFNEKIYIQGIGTIAYNYDDTSGVLTGAGHTGIMIAKDFLGFGRVNTALNEVIKKVSKNINKVKQSISILTIDVFGFSRGAAAARAFIYFALIDKEENIKYRLQIKEFTVGDVKVQFSGLFDTVAAFGTWNDDDTEDLHLDAIKASTQVVHLVAKDEYRENFPLTDISSRNGLGKEILLPGVHSDIGGGYVNNMQEENLVLLELINPLVMVHAAMGYSMPYYQQRLSEENKVILNKEKEKLIKEGWYKEGELDISNNYQLKVNRLNIRNTYSLIPLHIMKKYSVDFGLKFLNVIDKKYCIPAKEFYLNKLMDCITTSGEGKYEEQFELMKHIRQLYFHSSANYSALGMSPRYKFGSDTIKERKVYHG